MATGWASHPGNHHQESCPSVWASWVGTCGEPHIAAPFPGWSETRGCTQRASPPSEEAGNQESQARIRIMAWKSSQCQNCRCCHWWGQRAPWSRGVGLSNGMNSMMPSSGMGAAARLSPLLEAVKMVIHLVITAEILNSRHQPGSRVLSEPLPLHGEVVQHDQGHT